MWPFKTPPQNFSSAACSISTTAGEERMTLAARVGRGRDWATFLDGSVELCHWIPRITGTGPVLPIDVTQCDIRPFIVACIVRAYSSVSFSGCTRLGFPKLAFAVLAPSIVIDRNSGSQCFRHGY